MDFDKLLIKLRLALIKRKEYNFIIPIGEGCYSAIVLRKNKMRFFSSPFDWSRVPNYLVPIRLLESDFKDFFNKNDLKYIKTDDIRQEDWYKNIRTNIIYRHDFKKGSEYNFEECYKEAYEKYEKRCNRLIDIINNCHHRKICLLYIERADDTENTVRIPDKVNNYQLQKEIDRLNKHFGRKCFDIFYFKHEPKYNRYKFEIKNRICHLNNTYLGSDVFAKCMGNYEILNKVIEKRFSLKQKITYMDKIARLWDYYKITFLKHRFSNL